jgi:hypothetical protein
MTLSLSWFLVLFSLVTGDEAGYEASFHDHTMRVDLFHAGTNKEEDYSVDAVFREGEWPGSRVNLIDTLNLGEYLLRVFEVATGRMIYSRGYSTMFNEWQTTDEAAHGVRRTFSETLRFPYPRRTVQVTISRRDKRMVFHEVFTVSIDPDDPLRVRKEQKKPLPVITLLENGSPSEKVDIVILGDGYSRKDLVKYRDDLKRYMNSLFSVEPFKRRTGDFNVWAVEVESDQSGIDVPDKDLWRNNALGASYNTFGSARYVLTESNTAVRDAAASSPYDFVCILVNDTRYGGGGIYNLYSTTYTAEATKSQEWQMDYVFVHEFGHSFGGLGDEYYTSSTAYNDFYSPGIEPWEPNVTALVDPKRLKWAPLVTSGVPIPTPWEKVAYDSVESLRGKLDRLAPDYYEKREPYFKALRQILESSKMGGKIGAFEGSGYASKGLYRPSIDCRMFSLSLVGFDPVCAAAIERMIDFYSR